MLKSNNVMKAKVHTSPLALENPGLVSAFFVQKPILTSFSYCNMHGNIINDYLSL